RARASSAPWCSSCAGAAAATAASRSAPAVARATRSSCTCDLTERPHILPPPPGGGAIKRDGERGAAFFDLDRTLIAGSSSFQFGRAAYKAGLMSRTDIARDALEH